MKKEYQGSHMHQMKIFLFGDAKNVMRDPLMLLVLGIPLYMYLVAVWGIPFVDTQLNSYTSFQLTDHFYLIVSFLVLMAPMMLGMLAGFLLLDEKDEGIFHYMEVTPLKRIGFIRYRITLPLIISFIISTVLALLLLTGEESVRWGLLIPSLMTVSLFGPLITMYLAAFCKNKVEGMTYAKLISVLSVGPVITYMFDDWWVIFAYILPMTWLVELLYTGMTGSYFGLMESWPVLYLGGTLNILVYLVIFYGKLQRSL